MRIFLVAILAILLAGLAVFFIAGRTAAPVVQIAQPTRAIGVSSTLEVTVEAPKGTLDRLDIALEQGGTSTPLFSLATPASGTITQETPDRIRVARPIGKRALPNLQPGAARIVVTAARSALFGLRSRESTVSRDVQARFIPPRVSVVSTHHFIHHGGSEMVVYRADPPDVESGVQVGDEVYPGYAATVGGAAASDPTLKIAFFALLYDQDLTTPMRLYARDDAGNRIEAQFEHQVFPKAFHKGRIELTDGFMQRVVPEILAHSPEMNLTVAPGESYLPAYLRINNDLRRANAARIIELGTKSAPEFLWKGAFLPLGNAAVESRFADHRTYYYQGKEVDRQVHLGFDLAVTANVPVKAGNDGKVVFADFLGIYGNCVIIDHGVGISSLYAHLSSIAVKTGDVLRKGDVLGRSGTTGLAGGDHLHFSMQVQGHPVDAVEWWDPHWIEDRVERKLREAGLVVQGRT